MIEGSHFSWQVLLRFLAQRGLVVLAKSVTKERIAQNFNIFDFSLSSEDMAVLKGLDKNLRLCVPKIEVDGVMIVRDAGHPEFPFNADF